MPLLERRWGLYSLAFALTSLSELSAAPQRWTTASGSFSPVLSSASTIHRSPHGASARRPTYTAQCVNGTIWSFLGQ